MAIKTFSAGAVLTASDTNTYLANSGLVYVTSVAISPASSTITVSNCFSSTYDNYLIKIDPTAVSGSGFSAYLKLSGSTGTTNQVAGYYQTISSGSSAFASQANTADGMWLGVTSSKFAATIELFYPNKAEATFFSCESQGGLYLNRTNGYDSYTGASTGFSIFQANAYTLSGGSITVYGYQGITMSDPLIGTFHDAETGETITRELTQEEIDALPQNAYSVPAE